MVSQVGLNPSINANLGTAVPSPQLNPNNINSLTNPLTNPNNNYANDIMMSGMDFGAPLALAPNDKISQNSDVQIQNPQQQPEIKEKKHPLNFRGESEEQKSKAFSDEPKQSNIAKIGCAVLGFLAPLANKTIALLRGGKVKDLFKIKELAVTCPVIAVAGFGTGMLIDSCIDSYKAKKLDAKA